MTLEQADALMRQHRLGEAVEAYRAVLRQGKSTVSLYSRLATALHQQNLGEPARWQEEQVEWEHALIIDPENLQALRGLFALQKLKLQFFSDAKSIAALRDAAGELILAEPSNREAQSWIDASYLIDWLGQTDAPDHDMNVHRQALAAQLQKNPHNPLFAYYIARTFIRQAESLQKRGTPADEKQHLEDAVAVMQKTVDADPQNSASWLLFYRVLLAADQVVRSDDKNDSTYSDQIPPVLSKAQETAKPDDSGASEVATSAAGYLADHHQSAQAEQVLRQRLAVAPDDQSARLMLAKVVDHDVGKRPEMIELLRRPVTDPGGPLLLSCKVHSALERETQIALLQLLITQWAAAPPGPQRTQISDEIDQRMADLQRAAPQSISTLQLHAKLLMLRGGSEGAAEAVPELEKARRLFQLRSGELNTHDWDLDYLLATAYTLTNQTGLAKTLLWQIVEARPDAPQVHKSLLRLLIVDHEPDLASEQLQQLKRLTPTDGDLPQFAAAIALLRPGAGQRPDVQAVLKALPESTPQQIHAKITDERAGGRTDEVIRLYELLRKQNPADVPVVNTLLSLYVASGQNDRAKTVIKEALAAEPKNLALQLADAELRQDAAKIDQLTRRQMDAIADPFDRDMAWHAFHLRRHETKEAMQNLDDAEKVRPQDPKLLNERFRIALEQKQWDVAEKYVTLLGKIDADETGGWFDRCRLDVARGDLDTALKDAQELVQRYPDFSGCWIRLASVQQIRGEYQKAIDNFSQGLKRQNESLECLKGLVACSLALHKQEDARRYIDQALQIDPNSAYFREQSASWEKANCTSQEIIVRRKSARDANVQSLDAWRDLFFAYYHVAADSHAASDIDQSATVAEQIKQQWPDDRFGYFALADVAKLRNDLVGGEKAICDLADRPIWSKSPVPWLALAQYYTAFRRTDLQEIALRRALDRDSQSIETQNANADFLIRQRRFNEALNLLSQDSPNAAIRRKVIVCLIELNRNDEALKACDGWLQIHPEDDTVRENQATLKQRLQAAN
jgi:tetratricopeptide (TPR) repeat protein